MPRGNTFESSHYSPATILPRGSATCSPPLAKTSATCNYSSGGRFIVFVRGGFLRGAAAVMVGSIYF